MEYNKLLIKEFMDCNLWVTFKNRTAYLRWANGIKCLNLLWCHGERIEENDFNGEIKAVSIRRGYSDGGRLQFTRYYDDLGFGDKKIVSDDFLKLFNTNINPSSYYYE